MHLRIGLLASTLVLPAGAQSLCSRIEAFTREPAVASAHWGVSVTRLDGTTVCRLNDAQLFRPASNNKIFTTATALALLGGDHRFVTRVTGKLNHTTGAIEGDLTLIGAGDANLDSNDLPYLPPAERPALPPAERPALPPAFGFHDLDDLVSQLAGKGVKSVTGDIVGDDTLFVSEPYPPSWNADDLVWGYGAPVSALTLANNELSLTVTPAGSSGEPAVVALDQHGIPYYTLISEATTTAAKSASGIAVERLDGSKTLRVYGAIARDSAPDHEEIAIAEPAAYAAMAFAEQLRRAGIAVGGVARAAHRLPSHAQPFSLEVSATVAAAQTSFVTAKSPVGGPRLECPPAPSESVLASHTSAGLLEDTLLTNKKSQNLHAELQLRALGKCIGLEDAEGAGVVRAFLLRAGVLPEDFLLYDGSGLSDHDLVAPRALTTFLRFAATQPWFAEWKLTLPDSGLHGSLQPRFPNLRDRVSAKTGTLGESRALSGYVVTASGETRVFSVLVDTHLPGSADRVAMDAIVSAIAGEP